MSTLCPFCGLDPYRYVHNGIGIEPVAVDCCELGIELFNRREKEPETITIGWSEFIAIANALRVMRDNDLEPGIYGQARAQETDNG